MSLDYFNVSKLTAYITDAWQQELNTIADPAAGKWFKNGPGESPGLFGGLSATLARNLIFDASGSTFATHRDICATAEADNRDGLLTDGHTVALQWTTSTSQSVSRETSTSTHFGVSETMKAGGSIELVNAEVSTTYSVDFTYNWSNSVTNDTSTQWSFSDSVKVTPPPGAVYRVMILGDRQQADIPFTARISLSGVSETNFASPVNGATRHSVSAGTLCSWIKRHRSVEPGDQSIYDVDPANADLGVVDLRGVVSASRTINFYLVVQDWTEVYAGTKTEAQMQDELAKKGPGGAPGVALARPVTTQPVEVAAVPA